MDGQLQKINGELTAQKAEIIKLRRHIAETEEWRAGMKEEVKVERLQDKALDIQSRLMKNSIQVFNFPESVEDLTTMTKYLEDLFSTELDLPERTKVQITNAYWALPQKLKDSSAVSIVANFQTL